MDSISSIPFFSIIMVTYNAEKMIKRSLESLASQTCKDWELRLVDGGSSDSTLDIVKSMNFRRCIVTSSPDSGIYDAMNRGVASSNGDWLFFLNAGDELFDENVLLNILRFVELKSQIAHLVYGDISVVDGGRSKVISQKVMGEDDFRFRIPLCHQSVFYNRQCFSGGMVYDVRFSVCADYHHMAMLSRSGCSFVKCGGVVAKYPLGGFSHKKLMLLQLERLRIVEDVFGLWSAILFLPKFSIEYIKSYLLSVFKKRGGDD